MPQQVSSEIQYFFMATVPRIIHVYVTRDGVLAGLL